jgi:hypothetical protein
MRNSDQYPNVLPIKVPSSIADKLWGSKALPDSIGSMKNNRKKPMIIVEEIFPKFNTSSNFMKYNFSLFLSLKPFLHH